METTPPDFKPPVPPPPPPLPPLAYRGHVPKGRTRPAVVTTLAVLGIVWAIIELIIAVSTIFIRPTAHVTSHATTLPSYTTSVGSSGAVYSYHYSSTTTVRTARTPFKTGINLFRWMLVGLLMGSSIAALRLREWGRWGMIGWAWMSLADLAVTLTHRLFYGWASLQRSIRVEELRELRRHLSPAAAHTMALFPWVAAAMLVLVFQLFPIWVLATFNTPRIKSAFSKPLSPGG